MKKYVWWKRKRPGLYFLVDADGKQYAIIERGAELGRWWWEVWAGERYGAGRTSSLRDAKRAAVRAGWSHVRAVGQ